MKYFHLVWAALFRRKTRTIFTLLSVLAAFLLFGLLDSVRSAFADAGNTVAGVDRLLTMSKISFTMQLPKSLLPRIEAVPGVKEVAYSNWFGGVYQDPKNFFPNIAVSPNFFSVYSEFELPPDQREAFAKTRTGAVVGEELAKKFHWKIGDKIPLNATIFPQKDGNNTWTFDLVGIFKDAQQKNQENQMFFNWDYFDEARQFGNGNIGWYILRVADRGPGIPPEAIPRIFDKFYRARGAAPGGSGLGLSIVKGFVEAQGGRVLAENQPEGGAAFTLFLPITEPPAFPAEPS